MKKFKLIKEYPGSPMLGTEQISNKTWNTDIQKFPEFWEEVVEKEYEILSFKTGVNIRTLSQQNGLYYFQSDGKDLKYLINNKFYNIHSVKRLSDGEVFTVGDKLYGYDLGRCVDLTMFKLDKDRCLVGHRDLGLIDIKDCKKAKQPLFTTEDGVEIFENTRFWFIKLDSKKWNIWSDEWSSNLKTNDDYRYFSTKEKAEEYIIMNKPILSVNV